MTQSKVAEILLVDDNPAEAELIKLAWQQCEVAQSHVSTISDSRSTIAYLHGNMEYEGSRIRGPISFCLTTSCR